jgi:catechol 2,3-dioxygenase-like lactoylglutathione lyase family enzyme
MPRRCSVHSNVTISRAHDLGIATRNLLNRTREIDGILVLAEACYWAAWGNHMKYEKAVPVICTADVAATVAFYKSALGFAEHFVFGDPPVYAGVERDGVLLYIAQDARLASMLKSSDLHPDVFLWVRDIDRSFEEHRSRGVKIVEEISDRAWDARQYVIEDPNGYHLKIAEPLDNGED